MYVYVLKLENNKYFVGNTYNPYFSLDTYRNIDNDSNLFTSENKPITICKFISKCNEFDEDKIVKNYMDIYGIDNVRGGTYNKLELTSEEKHFIQKELCSVNDIMNNVGKSVQLEEDNSLNTEN